MTGVYLAAAAAFMIAWVLTPTFRALGHRIGHFDIPGDNSSHTVPTPRSGGYAVLVAIVVAVGVSGGYRSSGLAVIAGGAVLLAVLATIDDMRPLPRFGRFVAQLAIALATVYGSHTLLQQFVLPFGMTVSFGAMSCVVSLVWIVGLINAYNFMDGLNGLASTEGIVCGVALAALFFSVGDGLGAVMAAGIAGACAGFLPWNLPSGSIFLGDVGSGSLGFGFALLIVRLSNEGVPIVAGMLPLLPFLLDAGVTLVWRALRGEKFFSERHRSHFYQRLNQTGWSHGQVTALYGLLAVASSALAVAYPTLMERDRVLALFAVFGLHAVTAAWISARLRR